MARKDLSERLEPKSVLEWRKWLEKNHDTSSGVRLVIRKKNSAGDGVGYEEAVEEALAFGWIDSKANSLDDNRFMQMFTPRRPGSHWSKSNKVRIERLTSDGRMAPAGLAKVAEARRDGSWTRLDLVEAMVVPDDLKQALKADPLAKTNFEALADSSKKAVIFWIESAKRKETRSRRIDVVVESAKAGRSPFDD